MALPREDHWVAVLGLVAVASGYWYWTHRNQPDSTGNQTAANQTTEDNTVSPLVMGLEQNSNNVTTPSMVFNPVAGFNTPTGQEFSVSGQALPLPVNG